MASIYQLNQPPNPFWDFVTSNLEDHPFFAPRGHHGHGRSGHRHPHHERTTAGDGLQSGDDGEATGSDSNTPNNCHRCNHRGKGKHGYDHHGHPGMKGPKPARTQKSNATAADEAVDPSVAADNSEGSSSESDCPNDHRHKDHKKKWHGPGHHGPGPFRGKGGKGKHGHSPHGPYEFRPHGHSHHGPAGFGFMSGPRGMHGMGKHGHGPHHDPRRFPGHHDHRGSRGGPFGFGARGPRGPGGRKTGGPPGGPFDFLRNIGAGLGFPMEAPADGVDFTPSVDVFDTPANYVVHVSLPGAKRSDLSIVYDAEDSVLRLAGVVYRPGVNEVLHQALVMEERGQEIGVFEREVRFGTRVAPAPVVIDGISAKLEDGVLNVTLPKIAQDPQVQTRKISIEDGGIEKDFSVTEKTLTPVESEDSGN
ncbi:unnamed protein product [Penicillium salamii]|nr:unnamed protein product [Penicillium salamii]CAG8320028.1 unnamed protein product [Penicillium salamii]CAG8407688.1 unnamed protein product [Penicillium salamii]